MGFRQAIDAPKVICVDCERDFEWATQATIERGSSVREPGETVCPSCIAKRSKMVRELSRLPDNLIDIRAMARNPSRNGMTSYR